MTEESRAYRKDGKVIIEIDEETLLGQVPLLHDCKVVDRELFLDNFVEAVWDLEDTGEDKVINHSLDIILEHVVEQYDSCEPIDDDEEDDDE